MQATQRLVFVVRGWPSLDEGDERGFVVAQASNEAPGQACSSLAAGRSDVVAQQVDAGLLAKETSIGGLSHERPLIVRHDVSVEEVGEVREVPGSLARAIKPSSHLQDGHHGRCRYKDVIEASVAQGLAVASEKLKSDKAHLGPCGGPDQESGLEVLAADSEEIDGGNTSKEPALLMTWISSPVLSVVESACKLIEEDIDGYIEIERDSVRRQLPQHDQRGRTHQVQPLSRPELRGRA